ncbi:hypothetical protein GGI35DRAFT_477848 [Trichoderma velutinum]
MKSPQVLSALPLFLLGLATVVQGQSCMSGHLYCGYALQNMGWSKNDLIVIVTNDPDPSQGAIDHPGQALYQCLDSEEVFYVGYCNEGCDAMDDDYDDICNGE